MCNSSLKQNEWVTVKKPTYCPLLLPPDAAFECQVGKPERVSMQVSLSHMVTYVQLPVTTLLPLYSLCEVSVQALCSKLNLDNSVMILSDLRC